VILKVGVIVDKQYYSYKSLKSTRLNHYRKDLRSIFTKYKYFGVIMKILHLIPNSVFTKPYINFVNKHFDSNKHLFIVPDKERGYGIIAEKNVKLLQNSLNKAFKNLFFLIQQMQRSEKIILHGLFNKSLVLLLFFQPWLLKKSYWVIWGGDLYWYKFRERTFKAYLYERLRKFVIANMGGLITHIKGDYELSQNWYGAKGNYHYCFMYQSNLFKEYDLTNLKKDNIKTYIQVGNSADPTNNHLEVFLKLEKYKERNIEIICPISYGNMEYGQKVINNGEKLFGDKFKPLTEFMSLDKYLEVLAKTDVAIFNHERQQAVGNIVTLLGLGKKVYLRNDITTWDFCIEHDLKVYIANEDFEDLFDEMDEEIKQKNIKNMKIKFSEKKLAEDLKKIFVEEPNNESDCFWDK
jgi:dTDP-N-acetylfucosamine:lipid II N-acetylfucosaminyltransferase